MTPTERRKNQRWPVLPWVCATCIVVVSLSAPVMASDFAPALAAESGEQVAKTKQGDPAASSRTSVAKRQVSPEEIERAVRDLDSDKFAEREAAVTELLDYGKAAVPNLSRAAVQGSAEVSWRAIYVLKEMALRLDFEELDAAEKALKVLAVSDNAIAQQRAAKVIGTLEQQRSARATDAIVKLGGKMVVHGYLKLDSDWKGGNAGLGYIARLQEMERISIEASSGVTDDAVAQLRKKMPDVNIHLFGKAFLGVGGDFDLNGMIVTSVVPESGAAKAGVETNDIIIEIDGKKVENFDALVKIIKAKNAGDEATLKFYRHATGDIVTRKTKLSSRADLLN